MATASRGKTNYVSGTSESEISIYQDIRNPYIRYIGSRRSTNPHGPRNVWYVENTQSRQRTGPFVTKTMAWEWANNVDNHSHRNPIVTTDLPSQNGTTPKPEIETPAVFQGETNMMQVESSDRIIEFACPHCAKPIIGLLARK